MNNSVPIAKALNYTSLLLLWMDQNLEIDGGDGGLDQREERRDEKKRLDHLKQDQIMLVIKRFSERKKVFRERKKTGKIRAKMFQIINEFHSISPFFVEFKKDDCRIAVERKKSKISRLPLVVGSSSFGAPRDRSYENYLLQNKVRGKKMRLVKHGLEECEFKITCNNDKSLSEIQLENDKESELVLVVVKVVHELDCRMVVKEIEDRLLKEIEKFGLWFEQDIDGESEDDNEKKLVVVNEEG
uniref:Uncharacterized protein n=1 Tax=Tanacetum cinerariifolium TaxID=118510 RepID=A0A6L2JSL0_TANCI|nr:hypothetical protein [Tanacetum cinerariifolium]